MDRKRCAVVGIGHRFHSWIPQIVSTYKEQAELVALRDPMIQRCHDVNGYFAGTLKPGTYDLFISVGSRIGTPRIALPLSDGDGQKRYRLGQICLK